jgi:hypothetical protein
MLVRHLTFANVCSALALAVALGTGGAYAANTVRSKDIVNGQVKAVDLKKNAVTSTKIKDGTVARGDLRSGSVDGAAVADASLSTADLAVDAVKGGVVADHSLTFDDIVGASVIGNLGFATGFVANGRCREFDVTVAGASPGESVVLSLLGDPPPGLVILGVGVTTAGTARGQLCNMTGATMLSVSVPVRIVTFR